MGAPHSGPMALLWDMWAAVMPVGAIAAHRPGIARAVAAVGAWAGARGGVCWRGPAGSRDGKMLREMRSRLY